MVQWRRARLLAGFVSIFLLLGWKVCEDRVPREAQRSGCERMLQVVSDLGWAES
jgi:hypothetical protein